MRKSLVLTFGLLAAFASQARAGVIFTAPSGSTAIVVPGVNYFGTGPQTTGIVTWTSSANDSTYGYTYDYGFGDSGYWDGGLGPMIGSNDSYSTMTLTFSSPVSEVGGFMNYASNLGSATIAAWDGATEIDSYTLSFSPGYGDNVGMWLGLSESSSDITSFTLSGSYIGAVDLSYSGLSATPEPSTLMLAGSGLLGLAGVVRRKIAAK